MMLVSSDRERRVIITQMWWNKNQMLDSHNLTHLKLISLSLRMMFYYGTVSLSSNVLNSIITLDLQFTNLNKSNTILLSCTELFHPWGIFSNNPQFNLIDKSKARSSNIKYNSESKWILQTIIYAYLAAYGLKMYP